jgi:plasmid maintenance system antidote protein VapI
MVNHRVPSPAQVIEKELDERGWSVEELAGRAGLAPETITAVLEDDRAISREIAKGLGKAFGTSADLWYQLSINYRWWLRDMPPETMGWMTPELRRALDEIEQPHVAKKRATVLLLASATANDVAWSTVFEDPRACNQRVWYQKWQHDPAIATALELATMEALHWRDAETARIEAHVTQQRRRAIAEGSLDAVTGLRKTALSEPSHMQIDASKVLLTLADEEAAAKLAAAKGKPIEVEVKGLDDHIERELARVATGGEAGDAEEAPGDADAEA